MGLCYTIITSLCFYSLGDRLVEKSTGLRVMIRRLLYNFDHVIQTSGVLIFSQNESEKIIEFCFSTHYLRPPILWSGILWTYWEKVKHSAKYSVSGVTRTYFNFSFIMYIYMAFFISLLFNIYWVIRSLSIKWGW